jgi:hypothetical protein
MADIQTRFNSYNLALQAGWASVNDIRRRENMPPIGAAGDVYRVQSNMIPADDLLESFDKRNPKQQTPIKPPPTANSRPAELLMERTWKKLIKREVWNVTNAAKKPEKFLERLERAYEEFEPSAAEELEVPAAVLAEAGEQVDHRALVAAHCEESRRRLFDLAGRVTADQLLAAVTGELESWHDRRPEDVLCLKS